MFVVNIAILILSLGFLYYLKRIHLSFNKRVFFGLFLGGLMGFLIKTFSSVEVANQSMDIYKIVSVGYTRLLQMLIYPILIISTLSAITKVGDNEKIGKIIFLIITTLCITTMMAAIISIGVVLYFDVDFSYLAAMVPSQDYLNDTQVKAISLDQPIYRLITDFISINPFADFTGSRSNSIGATVIFSLLTGIAYLGVKRKEYVYAEHFKLAVDVLYKIIMRLVSVVLKLSPYGIFALFCTLVVSSNFEAFSSLIKFVGISYLAIFLMLILHSILIYAFGGNLITYYKKVSPLLIFSLVSRSSAAAIPMNIETQSKLGVPPYISTLSASFGAVMGQNGCAGITPAILAVMLASSVGIDPTSFSFLIPLVIIIGLSSFGVAGVGGGATFAAIAVLGYFNMPLTIVALLIGIEPIIDMARTMLNVNGTVVSSVITAKLAKTLNKSIFKSKLKIKNPEMELNIPRGKLDNTKNIN
ncbi:putative L-cystine transporter [Candidatus Hepatincolaceae symbiont of Richtersius coronifer]